MGLDNGSPYLSTIIWPPNAFAKEAVASSTFFPPQTTSLLQWLDRQYLQSK